MEQTSRGKFNRLQRAAAEFTTSAFDGCGLRDHLPARPAPYASYPVLVHRLASLLHAAFRPRLATTPWRFAITSPPSEREGDLHPQAVKHARHTKKCGGRSHRNALCSVLLCGTRRDLRSRLWSSSFAAPGQAVTTHPARQTHQSVRNYSF